MKITKRLIIPKIKLILVVMVVIGVVFVLIAFLKSDFWSVKKVTCKYDGASCTAEIENSLGQLITGRNILFVSRRGLKQKVLKDNIIFKDVNIIVKLPSELIFELRAREPAVAIATQLLVEGQEASLSAKPEFLTTGDFFIVDNEGVVLSKEKKSELPLILTNTTVLVDVGEKLSQEDLVKGVELISNLRLNLFDPKLARPLSERSIEVWFKDNVVSVFSSKKDAKIQLDSLQLIFSRAKIEGRKVRRVDLRFDKPVVTYE